MWWMRRRRTLSLSRPQRLLKRKSSSSCFLSVDQATWTEWHCTLRAFNNPTTTTEVVAVHQLKSSVPHCSALLQFLGSNRVWCLSSFANKIEKKSDLLCDKRKSLINYRLLVHNIPWAVECTRRRIRWSRKSRRIRKNITKVLVCR